MHIASIGIDLGKTTFHLVALGEHNKVVDPEEVLTGAAIGLYREPASRSSAWKPVPERTSWEPHCENKGTKQILEGPPIEHPSVQIEVPQITDIQGTLHS